MPASATTSLKISNSSVSVHSPFSRVLSNFTFSPAINAVTSESSSADVVIDAVPDTTAQVPVPKVSSVPSVAVVAAQRNKSASAVNVGGS